MDKDEVAWTGFRADDGDYTKACTEHALRQEDGRADGQTGGWAYGQRKRIRVAVRFIAPRTPAGADLTPGPLSVLRRGGVRSWDAMRATFTVPSVTEVRPGEAVSPSP